MDKKIFSEEQVKEIIRKAAEMQKQSTESESENGLTMDELMEIGKDSGLDVDFIKTAAMEYENQRVTTHSGLNDTHIFEERLFNTELSETKIWDHVISDLTHHFGGESFGTTEHSRDKKEWSHVSISGIQTIVSLSKNEHSAKLKFSQRVGLGSPLTEGIMYGGGFAFLIMMIVTAFSNISNPILIALSPGLWSLSSIIVYQLDVAWRKKKLKGLKTLANKIINQLPSMHSEKKSISSENTSDIEIESEDLYASESESLPNNLKERE
ncbi:MAG: hypothetical protein ABJR05_10340 [Balneola sp.]